jgi:hypothetical protein
VCPLANPPDIIDVNITRPECNREVTVFHINSVDIDGALHDGYEIGVDGDMRDVVEDKYKAWLRNYNEVMVQVPSMGYVFLRDPVVFKHHVKVANALCTRTQGSHDVARNRILKDERSQTKRLLLRFPPEVELLNTVYFSISFNGEIELEVVPIRSKFSLGNDDSRRYTTTIARVNWKISVIRAETRKTKASGNKGADKLLAKLSSMSI